MKLLTVRNRRRIRDTARAGFVLSAVMVMVNLPSLGTGRSALAAGTDSGVVQLLGPIGTPTAGQVLTSGGSAVQFSMTPPSGAACSGGATGTPSYRWQTFFVDASVDVSTLTYASGPNAVGTSFVSAMLDTVGDPVASKNPAASPLGLISGIPTMAFSGFAAGSILAGTYKIGFACTTAGATEKFWSMQLTFTTDAADSPAKVTWAVAAPVVTTTTTPVVTTTTIVATSTTNRAATTTTVRSTTTTTASTVISTSTSTTSPTSVASTTTAAGSPTTTSAAGCVSCATSPTTAVASAANTGRLANTGSSSVPLVIWAALLLVFGRIAVLFARPVRVRPPDSR